MRVYTATEQPSGVLKQAVLRPRFESLVLACLGFLIVTQGPILRLPEISGQQSPLSGVPRTKFVLSWRTLHRMDQELAIRRLILH